MSKVHDQGINSKTSSPGRITRALPKSLAFHLRQPSRDDLPIKARLVEQFYNVDGGQKLNADVAQVFRDALAAQVPLVPLVPETDAFSELGSGLLTFRRASTEVPDLIVLAQTMVDIQNSFGQHVGYEDQTVAAFDIRDVERLVDAVGRASHELERSLAHKPIEEKSGPQQLVMLQKYLSELHDSVKIAQEELSTTTTQLKAQYRDEMRTSMSKLEQLEQTLYELNGRLERARGSIAISKESLVASSDKLQTLEYILRKFAEYDQITRQTRVRQLIVALIVAVVALCGYTIAKSGSI